MNILRTLAIGIIIGMANVIPGVSGSTIAVVFGIYDKFINAITLNIKKLRLNKKFVLPIIAGMASGVLIFSKIITVLYEKFPVQTNFFFTGLIIGSIPMLTVLATKTKKGMKIEKSKIASIIICALIGIAVMILFSLLESSFGTAQNMAGPLPVFSVKLALKIFVAGVFGAVAMIVPGISGSLLMLIMGVYPIVIKSIPALFLPESFFTALILLLPNGFGVLTGLLIGAKLIKNLLEKAPNHAYAVILGLLCGSALNICPLTKNIFQGGFLKSLSEFNGALPILSSAAALVLGGAMSFLSSKFSPPEEHSERPI
jgi:Predicted membrane protein